MRRHIVLIAPPWYPVPPRGYGGIELVVGLLATELRRRGERVTVFAAEDSDPPPALVAPRSWGAELGHSGERLRELIWAVRIHETLCRLGDADVVHDHCGFATLHGAVTAEMAPVVHTVHGALRHRDVDYYASLGRRVRLVAISDAQRRTAPDLEWIATVANAVDVASLHVAAADEREGYLLCLARVCPDKGQHLAIEVARRAGMRLVLAGKVEPTAQGIDYYERLVGPHIDGDRVIHVHNVGGAEKARLLARAAALLAPVQWDEPFGLAVAEAMVSGTPVVATPRGAMPELVEPGVTGLLAADVDEMVAAVRLVDGIDPGRCAATARRRFSPEAMADAYLGAYAGAGMAEAALAEAPAESVA